MEVYLPTILGSYRQPDQPTDKHGHVGSFEKYTSNDGYGYKTQTHTHKHAFTYLLISLILNPAQEIGSAWSTRVCLHVCWPCFFRANDQRKGAMSHWMGNQEWAKSTRTLLLWKFSKSKTGKWCQTESIRIPSRRIANGWQKDDRRTNLLKGKILGRIIRFLCCAEVQYNSLLKQTRKNYIFLLLIIYFRTTIQHCLLSCIVCVEIASSITFIDE